MQRKEQFHKMKLQRHSHLCRPIERERSGRGSRFLKLRTHITAGTEALELMVMSSWHRPRRLMKFKADDIALNICLGITEQGH